MRATASAGSLPLLVAAWLIACAGGAVILTPPGEAPDEPAHLAYVDALITTRSLPHIPSPGEYDHLNYEAHQPPLAYIVAAVITGAFGGGPVSHRFVPDGDFDFRTPGSRAFQRQQDRESLRRLRLARSVSVLWFAATLGALITLLRLMSFSPTVTAASISVAGGVPQLVWLSGVMNNDAALVAFSSWSVAALVWCVMRRPSFPAVALPLTGALLTKGSALFLLAPVIVTCVIIWMSAPRPERLRSVSPVAAAACAAVGVFVAFNLLRSGSLLPPVPEGNAAWRALLQDMQWPLRLAYSFWGKFGWMNTPLPTPWYIWFGIVTIAAAIVIVWMSARRHEALIPASAAAGNILLVIAYLGSVDLQTQGRYLLPSVSALAIGLGWTLTQIRGTRMRAALTWTALILGLAAPLAMLTTIATRFH